MSKHLQQHHHHHHHHNRAPHLLHQLLGVCWPFKEQLHNGSKQLQLDLGVFIMEALQETLQKLISIVNTLCILTNDPNHGGSVNNVKTTLTPSANKNHLFPPCH